MAAILIFGSKTASDNVRSNTLRSGTVENIGIAGRIAAPSLAVQKLFPLPVVLTAILNFGNLSSSTNVAKFRPPLGSVLGVKSDLVENQYGVAYRIASLSLSFKIFFLLRVQSPSFQIQVVN